MSEIRIDENELYTEAVDEIINMEQSLKRSEGEYVEDVKTPLYLNPIFYYTCASLVCSFIAWAIFEPFIEDGQVGIPFLSDYLLFGTVSALIGLGIGLTYGIANMNMMQSLRCGAIGIGVGLLATILTTVIADIIYGIFYQVAVAIQDGPTMDEQFPFKGFAFFILMCGRGIGWSIVSAGAGLGLGVSLKSKKMILNGLAGGLLGGMFGGLLFDPISRFVVSNSTEADISRCIGVMCVGSLVGLFIGIFENVSKDSWFLMMKGPLTGKQFNIFKSPMTVGSAPKCDIYLFKDAAIEPRHATITKSGNKYIVNNESRKGGVFVNGKKADKIVLNGNDVVSIGDTVLKYIEKEKR